MRFALLALLLPAFVAQGDDAEKLFRDMEKKISQAKALRVVADIDAKEKDKEAKLHIAITLAEGNKARMKTKGDVDGKKLSMVLVSDGKNLHVVMEEGGKSKNPPKQAAPERFTEQVAKVLARLGLVGGFKVGPRMGKGKEADLEKLFAMSNFKTGKSAKVNGREAKVLDYEVKIGGREDAKVTLWLDAATHLPIKREILADKDKVRITETYKEFDLNPKVDAKTFELTP